MAILNKESPEAWRIHTVNDAAPTLYAERPPAVFVKISRARDNQGEGERWSAEQVHPTLNAFDNGDTRCVCAIVHSSSLLSSACCPNPNPGGRP